MTQKQKLLKKKWASTFHRAIKNKNLSLIRSYFISNEFTRHFYLLIIVWDYFVVWRKIV